MKYTAELLYKKGVSTITVWSESGEIYYFIGVDVSLDLYFKGTDDCPGMTLYRLNPDGTQKCELEIWTIDESLEVINSGKRRRFDEDRDVSDFEVTLL